MSQGDVPSPQLINQYLSGHWASIALAAAVEYSVFTRIERGENTCAALARAAGISTRGAQGLLDGLVGLGLLTTAGGRYATTRESSFYLVEGKPAYLGAWATRLLGPDGELALWTALPDIVKRGRRAEPLVLAEAPFWDKLVVALIPAAWPVAQHVGARLGFASLGPVRMLDVGGGAGVYSAALLTANPQARSTQVDWANVNRIARDYVGKMGVGERFETRDGDLHEVDFGAGIYDLAIYSHIAHGLSPEQNAAAFRRLRRALAPGGTLIVVDFVVNEDRSGPPFALLFHLQMLIGTPEGATWRESDYRRWLGDAGFTRIDVEPTPTGPTAIFAR